MNKRGFFLAEPRKPHTFEIYTMRIVIVIVPFSGDSIGILKILILGLTSFFDKCGSNIDFISHVLLLLDIINKLLNSFQTK